MTKFFLAVLLILTQTGFAQKLELSSPNGRLKLIVEAGNSLSYSVIHLDKALLSSSSIDMYLKSGSLTKNARIKKTKINRVRKDIIPEIAEKRKIIPDNYNELVIEFKSNFSLLFRAYDDGIAYRFRTSFRDSITVVNELASMVFPADHPVIFSPVVKREGADIYHTSFEEPYQTSKLSAIDSNFLIFSPLLIAPELGPKLLLTESDIEDYPGMFVSATGKSTLVGKFAPYPLEEKMTEGEFPQYIVSKRADFIARTKGTRDFPWRIIAVAEQDNQLPGNDIVYRLASPSRIGDASWVKPGKGTDEWIIGINLFNVPFKSGINTATYKYYIDFAKRFGLDRIMLDAGWSDYKDLFKINPALNMDEIASYAREKGIKLSMWTLALTLDKQLEPALEQFNKWGVDFIMTDFMDRDDQQMMNFYYRIATACARHRIMVMYHGAFKPAGFGRTFPNAITREGVLGSEYNIWSEKATPQHNVLLPFIRMVAGPMDYEPGILDNATQKTFRPIGDKVMASGTRCHQLAMFVVYESPIQIFSGNPSVGWQEEQFMELLGSIPTTWDETIIPDARLGEYIITARKKGNQWFIASMCNWTTRDLNLALDFLEPGNYHAKICEDGINADRYASDYVLKDTVLTNKSVLPIKMAPGGGYLLRLTKQ